MGVGSDTDPLTMRAMAALQQWEDIAMGRKLPQHPASQWGPGMDYAPYKPPRPQWRAESWPP